MRNVFVKSVTYRSVSPFNNRAFYIGISTDLKLNAFTF